MRKLLICICLTFSLLSCSFVKQTPNQYNQNKQAHGRFIYYYDRAEGIVHSTGRYKKGKPVGLWMTFHENGGKYIRTRHFKNRAREVRFYPNGKLEKKGWSKLLLDDPAQIRYYWDGKWKLYDEDGKLFRVLLFSEGKVIDILKNLNPDIESIEME
jgi:antitoxin component YwqK of YwqJK toxin-antitoxin module